MSEEKLDTREKKWAIPFLFIWTIIFAVLFYPFVRKFLPKQIHDICTFVSIGIIFVSIIYTTGIIFQYKTDLKNHKKRIVRWAYSFVKFAFILTVFLFFPLHIWSSLHQLPINGFHFYGLSLFIGLAFGAAETFVTKPKLSDTSNFWRTVQLVALPAAVLSIFLIVSLLLLDIITFFTTPNLDVLYPNPEIKSFLFTLYTGALAIIAFGVTLYVAYIRHSSLKLSEKQFEHTQQQFSYTQTQKQEEEIEKRFQEGIKLLGNEQESVRLGGIFVLWEIVKDAVKALPYLEHENVYYAEYTDDNHQPYILPYHLEIGDSHPDPIDQENQIELKDRYRKNLSAGEAKISTYKKAFSLYEQILNILCAHIRTKTNSENYLKEYYPSIYQKRYSQKFKEVFGEQGEFNSLEEINEKPSNEIQSLLNLLVKASNKKVANRLFDSRDPRENYMPCYILGFQLNFAKAIFKGGDFTNAFLQNADCVETNFQKANCCNIKFKNTNCSNTNFEQAFCHRSAFQNSSFPNASFNKANCMLSNFKDTNCYQTSFQYTNCNQAKFQKASCFNADFQHANLSEANFQDAVCIDTNFQNALCSLTNFQLANCLDANFQNASFGHTNFQGTYLNRANFKNTKRSRANFDGAHNPTLYTLSLFT